MEERVVASARIAIAAGDWGHGIEVVGVVVIVVGSADCDCGGDCNVSEVAGERGAGEGYVGEAVSIFCSSATNASARCWFPA